MKLLSIGNSFSQDAQRYLYDLAHQLGLPLKNVNLYIGGCSLERHHRHLLADEAAYELQAFGHETGFPMSIRRALLADDWDAVTLQQVSSLSPHPHTYQPYLSVLAEEVRRLCPRARLVLHQVWGYANGSQRLAEAGFASHADMMAANVLAYRQAARETGAEVIPAGQVMAALVARGHNVHRDTFHATMGLGRYALALTWLAFFFGKEVLSKAAETPFTNTDLPLTAAERRDAMEAIAALL